MYKYQQRPQVVEKNNCGWIIDMQDFHLGGVGLNPTGGCWLYVYVPNLK